MFGYIELEIITLSTAVSILTLITNLNQIQSSTWDMLMFTPYL